MAAAAGSLYTLCATPNHEVYRVDTSEEYETLLKGLGIQPNSKCITGNFGRVSPHSDPNFVVKFQSPRHKPLEDQAKLMRMATQEVFIQLSLNGIPSVPTISDVVICKEGRIAFVMENAGEDIFTLFNDKGLVPSLPQLQAFVNNWIRSLSEIHAKGILHRDIKPENLTVTHIIDFGLSRKPKDGTTTGLAGTAQYMSPEMVLRNAYGVKHDAFSFGTMLFTLFQNQYLIPIEPYNLEERIAFHKCLLDGDIQTQINHLTLIQDALGELPQKLLKERNDICTLEKASGKWILKPSKGIPRYKTLSERMLSNARCSRYNRESVLQLIDLIEKLTHLDPDIRISCKEATLHPFLTTPIEYAQQDSPNFITRWAQNRRELEGFSLGPPKIPLTPTEEKQTLPPKLTPQSGIAPGQCVATFCESPYHKC